VVQIAKARDEGGRPRRSLHYHRPSHVTLDPQINRGVALLGAGELHQMPLKMNIIIEVIYRTEIFRKYLAVFYLVLATLLSTSNLAQAQDNCVMPPPDYSGPWLVNQHSRTLQQVKLDFKEAVISMRQSGSSIIMDLTEFGVDLKPAQLDGSILQGHGSHEAEGSVGFRIEFDPENLKFRGEIKYALIFSPLTFEGEMQDPERTEAQEKRQEAFDRCQDRIDRIKEEIRKKIVQLEQTNHLLKQQFEDVTERLGTEREQRDADQSRYQEAIRERDGQIKAAAAAKSRRSKRVQSLERALKDKVDELTSLGTDLKRQQQTVVDTEARTNGLLKSSDSERQELKERIKNLQAQLDVRQSAETARSAGDDGGEAGQATLEEARDKVRSLENDLAQSRANEQRIKDEFNSISAQLKSAVHRLREMPKVSAALSVAEKTLNTAKDALKAREAEIEALEKTAEAGGRTLDELVATTAQLRDRLRAAEIESDDRFQTLKVQKDTLKARESEIDALQKSAEAERRTLDELVATTAQLRDRLRDAEIERDDKSQALQAQLDALKAAKAERAASDGDGAPERGTLEEALDEIKSLRNDLANAKAAEQRMNDELESTSAQLKSAIQRLREMPKVSPGPSAAETELKTAKDTLKAREAEIEALEKSAEAGGRTLDELVIMSAQLRERIRAAEVERDAKSQALLAINNKISALAEGLSGLSPNALADEMAKLLALISTARNSD
jgi:chromosome segregation ATPase